MWGSNDNTYSKADERNEYDYIQSFNQFTNEVEKKKIEVKKSVGRSLSVIQYVFLGIVLGAMIYYNTINLETKDQYD